MHHSPFGSSCVKDKWPYLGATITSRSQGIDAPPDRRLSPDMVDSLLMGTWGKPITKMGMRAITLRETAPSPSKSAAAWNAYMVSLVPYPAHYMAPSPADEPHEAAPQSSRGAGRHQLDTSAHDDRTRGAIPSPRLPTLPGSSGTRRGGTRSRQGRRMGTRTSNSACKDTLEQTDRLGPRPVPGHPVSEAAIQGINCS